MSSKTDITLEYRIYRDSDADAMPQAAQDGLTIVACLPLTGEIAGALLANDAAAASPEDLSEVNEKFGPIVSILGKLDEVYLAGREPRPGEMLHLYLLGVSDRAAGQGVGQQLVARALENGVRRAYRVAYAEATNRTSQHIFRKLGFAERAQLHYRDHLFRGRKVFAEIADHGGPVLMEKLLAAPNILSISIQPAN